MIFFYFEIFSKNTTSCECPVIFIYFFSTFWTFSILNCFQFAPLCPHMICNHENHNNSHNLPFFPRDGPVMITNQKSQLGGCYSSVGNVLPQAVAKTRRATKSLEEAEILERSLRDLFMLFSGLQQLFDVINDVNYKKNHQHGFFG